LVVPRYCARIGHNFSSMDLIDAMTHEDGLFCGMRNAAAASEQLLRQLQIESLTRAALTARVAKCVESLQSRYGVRGGFDRASTTSSATFAFDTAFGLLRFVTYQAAFGLPSSEPQQQLARDMRAFWASFARYGRPADAGGRAWPQDRFDLVLAPGPDGMQLVDAEQEHHCALWWGRTNANP
jgi:carboxylesterase type B